MQTVVYARYSSQLQNSRSIDDQIADCRALAARENWTIVEVFTDYAISGAAGFENSQRPGLSALLDRVARGGVEQLLTESTDRIARHQGDDFAIRERLQHAGVRLFTLMEGEVDDITGTIKGLMNARFRKDLGDRTRRGQRGAVAQGRVPGGLAYGYRRANRLDEKGELVRGLREIEPSEAMIINRIFTEYAAGQSPRAIAERLNAEGVPPPGSALSWRLTTILGDRLRNTGILNNRTYAGMLVYNRTRKVVDPVTRNRLIRPNPPSEWIEQAAPSLRIIDDNLWDAVRARRGASSGVPMHQQRRPKHLLSGLGECGLCTGKWTRQSHEYWGCSRRKDGRGCTNALHIRTDRYEQTVLTYLRSQLLEPEIVSEYVREYHREHSRLVQQAGRDRIAVERKLEQVNRRMQRLVDAVASGGDEFDDIRDLLSATKRDRESLQRQLASIDAVPVIALHPGIAESYRKEVDRLHEALADHEAAKIEAVPKLRALIDRIVLRPSASGTDLEIEVVGRMDQVLNLASSANTASQVSAVAPQKRRVR